MRFPRFLALALPFAALSAAAAPARAQTHHDALLRQLDTVAVEKRGQGYVVDGRSLGNGTLVGLLPRAGFVTVEVNLRAGMEYFVAGNCDRDCDDLDLRIVAPDAETVLDEDVSEDAVPVVSFVAREAGPYLLTIRMVGCKTEMCYFGVRVLARRER